ncbi:cytochrome aa3 quinol oxidase subunit III [Metabacillus niabensis]|uniref:Quinol oxidase subunit 3 n=1 Tax=Metabacillus niabensis TaxID=324854 RepID=A0ABT9YWJ6_9BACI|nr:cytochrome aa3 quinol oxidase subunit III [Metabacillus niabensis]MDQ0223972.1 cytochrome aa3-600 menaquinol oxidase subunit 3 [Metabacillus niabensis]PAD70485.1 cytochrome aa3 quinol oxidase subunit III [Bacillus sp. 7586-K]
MAQVNSNMSPNTPLEYQSSIGRLNIFGFWVFLGAEMALFATIFATFFVLNGNTGGGPLPGELFDLKNTMIMTLLLLTSSFTSGLAIHEMRRNNTKSMVIWTIITLLFGLGFLYLEIEEFVHLVHEGATIGTNAYWSSFYFLTGTHGLHVSIGICWITLILLQIKSRGLTPDTAKKVFISSLYWHFLDFVWIFVFTGVYLLGMVGS